MCMLTEIDCHRKFECRDVFHGGDGKDLYRLIIIANHETRVIAVLTDVNGIIDGTSHTCLSHPAWILQSPHHHLTPCSTHGQISVTHCHACWGKGKILKGQVT